MTEREIEILPGGLSAAAGGTRTSINLNRPWQADITIDSSTCPFETKEQKEIARYNEDGGWQVIENQSTPFSFHLLIIPTVCWPKEDLRVLGGEGKVSRALKIAKDFISVGNQEFWVGVHIGPLAGQNLGHLHYHLLQPIDRAHQSSEEVATYSQSNPLVIFEENALRVIAGGYRAGQCFIVPQSRRFDLTHETAHNLASVLSRIITLYNEKFRSTQGLPPDYTIGIKFLGSTMLYCSYIPILNNWGITEYLGLLERAPLILPWSHRTTVEHLRGNKMDSDDRATR